MFDCAVGALAGAESAAPPQRAALICMGSTFRVVIPPSLGLILLGDAHTEAVDATGMAVRIINTLDILRGALVPAAMLFLLCMAAACWGARKPAPAAEPALAPI